MIYYSDGYCLLKNPSPKGGGFTVFNRKNKLIMEMRIEKSGFTNNEAELLGVYNAIKLAKKFDSVVTDSQIALGWIYRKSCGSRKDLNSIAIESHKLMVEKEINLAWLPREYNLAGHYNEQYEEQNLFNLERTN